MGLCQQGYFALGWDFLTTAALSQIMINGNGGVQATNARFADGQSFELGTGGTTNGFDLGANLAHIIEGFYIYSAVLPSSGLRAIAYWWDNTANAMQLQLMVNSNGALQFYLSNGTTTVGAISPNGTIAAGRGAYIQVDITINSATGVVKCYVDTSGSSAVINSSSVNSQSTANAQVSQCWLQQMTVGTICYFDDFYILDMTGAAPFNAILGPVHMHADEATSDASPNQYSTQPSQTAGNHYKNTNSVTTPSGSAYNFDNTVGDEELYGFPAISATTVLAMTEWVYDELDAAGARTVQTVLTSGASTQSGTAYTPAATFFYHYTNSVNDPNTSATWASGTVTAAQNAKFGVKIVS